MRRRAVLMILLALVLGGATVFLIQGWVEARIGAVASKEAAPDMTTVVVATAPLEFGNRLRTSFLTEVKWPASATPPGSFKTVRELLGESGDGEGGEERVVLRPIDKGEPVLKTKISGFGARASLSAKIEKEMRAATIRVNDVLGVAGFILPGDRVDILLTRTLEGGNNQLVTDLLLQNIKVLGIDQDAAEARDKPRVARAVTLEVEPQQAQKLALALQVGTLSLALRHYGNANSVQRRRITLSDLESGEANRPAAPVITRASKEEAASASKPKIVRRSRTPYDPMATVKILRGLEESSEKVPQERPDSPGGGSAASGAPLSLSPKAAPSAPEKGPAATPTEQDLGPVRPSPAPGVETKPITLRPEVNSAPIVGLVPPSGS